LPGWSSNAQAEARPKRAVNPRRLARQERGRAGRIGQHFHRRAVEILQPGAREHVAHAAFGDALDALNAALVLQQSLDDPTATSGILFQVRFGLHLGVVERRDADLFGSPVNRAARIMKAAHGGQVLLSQAVADHVGTRLPSLVALRDLGGVRLRDLLGLRRHRAFEIFEAELLGAGLLILGVPLALPIAVLTFFGAYFPIVGGVVTGALAALVALAVQGPGTALVVVTQIKPIYVTFTVPERDLVVVRQTMARHPVSVLAFDGDDKQQLSEGRLTLVNNAVDQASGTVTLKSVFQNQDAALWPGEFINAHLVVDIVKNGVTVPAATVQMGPTGPFVYLIKPDMTVEARPVVVTQVESGTALVGKGLAVGDQVVASGQAGLSPGVKVAIQPGQPGEMVARQPEIGPEGVGSTGINTAPNGAGEIKPR